jgi:nitrate reductase alpha subunit
MEFTYPEMTATVSNPWVQIWKGGIRPLYDTRNDADTFGACAVKKSEMTGDVRIRQVLHFV